MVKVSSTCWQCQPFSFNSGGCIYVFAFKTLSQLKETNKCIIMYVRQRYSKILEVICRKSDGNYPVLDTSTSRLQSHLDFSQTPSVHSLLINNIFMSFLIKN